MYLGYKASQHKVKLIFLVAEKNRKFNKLKLVVI